MNPVGLRSWIQRYGNVGVLVVGIYLGWRHLWTRRRTALIAALVLVLGSSGFLVWAHYQTPHPRNITAPVTPVVSPAHLNEDLRAAIRHNNLAAVSAALRAGANVNAADGEGNTALMLAADNASEDIVRLLIRHGANVHAKSKNFSTAMHYAVHRNRTTIVRLLLDNGADSNDRDLVGDAAEDGNNDILRLLLAHGAEVNATNYDKGSKPLIEAAKHHHLDTVALLLAKGADIDANVRFGSALTFAAQEGDLAMVKFLVLHGADVNFHDGYGTVLESAVGHPDVVRFLLRHRAYVDKAGKWDTTPLILAARDGNLASINILLQHGANVNYVSDSIGKTPLKVAAEEGRVQVVKMLLRWGAEVNLRTEHHEIGEDVTGRTTALQEARKAGHADVVRLLKRAGARE